MPDPKQKQRWQEVKRNPSLYPNALSDKDGAALPWHDQAHLPHSSQVFCVSAFATLNNLKVRDRVLSSFLSAAFPAIAVNPVPSQWPITPEASDRTMLGERGHGQPTSIDALCVSSNSVVCIESKFLVDAEQGLGGCSQTRNGSCRGFYGPGSDAKAGTDAWCRLENWDGRRSPRMYWAIGKRYFKAEIFEKQESSQACPFKGAHYQLMRNFLYAAASSVRSGKSFFAVLVVAPRKTASLLAEQIGAFQTEVLRPDYRTQVALAHYEDYVAILNAQEDSEARDLAAFLQSRMNDLIP